MNCSLLPTPRAGKAGRGARPAWYWLLAALAVLASATGALAQTVTIGSVALPATSPATSDYTYGPIYQPAGGAPNYSRYAHLYTAAELGIPSGSTITQLDWVKANGDAVTGNNSLEVLLSNTSATSLGSTSWGTLVAGATSVYSSTTFSVTGAAGTSLTVPATGFVYTGGSLLVLTDWAKGSAVSGNINFITNPAAGLGIGQKNFRPLNSGTTLSAATYGDRRPTLRLTYVPSVACTAPPAAGTAMATASSVCAGSVVSLTLSGATLGTGLTYQWQASATGAAGSYVAIAGATGSSYTTPILTQTQYYRALVTCSGQTATSAAAQVAVLAPTYAAVPYTQGFEAAWLSRCGTSEVPDASWLNTPVTGDNSWRRENDTTSAGWTQPGVGLYSPTGSNAGGASSLHSARFHNASFLGSTGTLDLYVNLGSGTGTPTLQFDYYNPDSNTVQVLLSTDGGATFPTTLQTLAGNTAWTNYLITLPSTVTATSVIRFQATTNYGVSDNGIDNVNVSYVLCAQPTNLAATVSPAGATATANLTFTPAVGAASYVLGLSPAVASAPTTVAGSPFSLAGLAYSTTYTVTLTTTCATSTSQISTYSFTTPCAPPTYAPLPYSQGFEATWLSRCDTHEVPDTHWRNTPTTGDNSWRREDDGASANWTMPTTGIYAPAGSQSSHSARFHNSASITPGITGSLDLYADLSTAGTKVLSFDYINNSTINSKLDILLSTDGGATFAATPLLTLRKDSVFVTHTLNLTATSATTVIRFQATSDYSSEDIGLDNVLLRLLSAVDPAATSLVAPSATQDCFSNAETVAVALTNAGLALNFATNPTTVKAVVTLPGGTTQTLTATVSTGTLAAGASQTVQLAPALNMNQVGTYSFVLMATAPGDTNPANDTLKPAVVRTLFAPLVGLLSPASTTICTGSTTVLALNGYASGSAVLQRSSNNVTFTDVTGLTGNTYTTPALTATTYYRVQVRCGANIATSNLSTVTVSNPLVTNTNTPVGICVGSSATLTATASTGSTVRFFSAATGGTALATTTAGSYTTPALTASTTYYAEAFSGTRESVGLVFPSTTTGFLSPDYGVVFSTTGPVTLLSATVYPVGAGTLTFALVNSAGVELAATPALSVSGAGFATPVSVNLGLAVPAAGTDYRLVLKAYTGLTDLLLESTLPTGAAYPFTTPSGLLTLTSGYFSGSTSTSSNGYFYNLIVSSPCISARTAIQVNVTPPPATPTITTTGSPATGITLASSALTGNQWYLNGVAIAGATGQTYLVNSGALNGSYTVVASSGGCASAPSAAVAVTVTATTAGRSLALALHPNPTPDGLVTLELGGATSPTELTVLDALGRVVFTRQLPANANRYELDLGTAASGVYLLRLRNADGVATRRLTRQ